MWTIYPYDHTPQRTKKGTRYWCRISYIWRIPTSHWCCQTFYIVVEHMDKVKERWRKWIRTASYIIYPSHTTTVCDMFDLKMIYADGFFLLSVIFYYFFSPLCWGKSQTSIVRGYWIEGCIKNKWLSVPYQYITLKITHIPRQARMGWRDFWWYLIPTTYIGTGR